MKEGASSRFLENRLKFTPEIMEFSSAFSKVDVNGYHTLREDLMTVNGTKRTWHLMKGGGKTKFEVYFLPDTNEWLKTMDPEVENIDKRITMLKDGIDNVRTGLVESGLNEHAIAAKGCTVERSDGSFTVGHKTKHIGPTVEYICKRLKGKNIDDDTKNSLEEVVIKGFNLAARLYILHDIWMEDPNPGNIVLNFDDLNNIKIALIDFESMNQYKGVEGDLYRERFESLFKRFEKKAKHAGISISRDQESIADPDVLYAERMKRKEI
ncbi:hypothetical protein KKF69_08585 [Patescibacteria group bacterium]|nr:hypothetical protein [Patescibacteria group bacterium]